MMKDPSAQIFEILPDDTLVVGEAAIVAMNNGAMRHGNHRPDLKLDHRGVR